jgi:hypothetical protein
MATWKKKSCYHSLEIQALAGDFNHPERGTLSALRQVMPRQPREGRIRAVLWALLHHESCAKTEEAASQSL